MESNERTEPAMFADATAGGRTPCANTCGASQICGGESVREDSTRNESPPQKKAKTRCNRGAGSASSICATPPAAAQQNTDTPQLSSAAFSAQTHPSYLLKLQHSSRPLYLSGSGSSGDVDGGSIEGGGLQKDQVSLQRSRLSPGSGSADAGTKAVAPTPDAESSLSRTGFSPGVGPGVARKPRDPIEVHKIPPASAAVAIVPSVRWIRKTMWVPPPHPMQCLKSAESDGQAYWDGVAAAAAAAAAVSAATAAYLKDVRGSGGGGAGGGSAGDGGGGGGGCANSGMKSTSSLAGQLSEERCLAALMECNYDVVRAKAKLATIPRQRSDKQRPADGMKGWHETERDATMPTVDTTPAVAMPITPTDPTPPATALLCECGDACVTVHCTTCNNSCCDGCNEGMHKGGRGDHVRLPISTWNQHTAHMASKPRTWGASAFGVASGEKAPRRQSQSRAASRPKGFWRKDADNIFLVANGHSTHTPASAQHKRSRDTHTPGNAGVDLKRSRENEESGGIATMKGKRSKKVAHKVGAACSILWGGDGTKKWYAGCVDKVSHVSFFLNQTSKCSVG